MDQEISKTRTESHAILTTTATRGTDRVARIRTIKPEFWTDEKLSLLDPLTRLVFLGLVSLADDYGRLIDNVKLLDGQIFPHTDDSVLEPLVTLAKLSRVLRYRSKAGQQCIQIIGWTNHQKVDHPGKEVIPAPTKEDYAKPVTGQQPIVPPKKASRQSREILAQPSRLIPTTNDQRPTTVYPQELSGRLYEKWIVSREGAVEYPAFRKALKPLFPEKGALFTETELLNAIQCFGEVAGSQNPKEAGFWTIYKFAGDAGRWVRLGKMPKITESGELTERGRLIAA